MNRLNYPQKFTPIGFIFAMPLTLVMYFLISEINSRVDLAQKEIYGNQYLRPLLFKFWQIPIANYHTY
ncbi:MAG: hypothetical protein WBL95_17030 [Microcoleus sp.]